MSNLAIWPTPFLPYTLSTLIKTCIKKGFLSLALPDTPTSTLSATRTARNIRFSPSQRYLCRPTCFKSTKMTKRTSCRLPKGTRWLINMPSLVSWSHPFTILFFLFLVRLFGSLKAVKLRLQVFSSCANKVHWNSFYIFDCSGKAKVCRKVSSSFGLVVGPNARTKKKWLKKRFNFD